MEFPFERKILSEDETIEVANKFAEIIDEGDVIALIGNLGSGKTFFVKAIGNRFEISNVSSPSFAIVNVYEGLHRINHFDFYRIKKINELYDIGYNEYLSDLEAITFIEWADMYPELLPKSYYIVSIKLNSNSERTIIIEKNG